VVPRLFEAKASRPQRKPDPLKPKSPPPPARKRAGIVPKPNQKTEFTRDKTPRRPGTI
jgi:hypothetical protein